MKRTKKQAEELKSNFYEYLNTGSDRIFTNKIYPDLVSIFNDATMYKYNLTHETLEDIRQEALIKVVTKVTVEALDRVKNIDNYLFRMFDNYTKDYIKVSGRYKKHVNRVVDGYIKTGKEWNSGLSYNENEFPQSPHIIQGASNHKPQKDD